MPILAKNLPARMSNFGIDGGLANFQRIRKYFIAVHVSRRRAPQCSEASSIGGTGGFKQRLTCAFSAWSMARTPSSLAPAKIWWSPAGDLRIP